jgi:hypothetical protein
MGAMSTFFFDNLVWICKQRGISLTGLAKAVGLSTGSPTAWMRGALPFPAARSKIVNYLELSEDEIVLVAEDKPVTKDTIKTKKAPDVVKDTEGEIDMDSVQFALFDGTRDLTAAQIEEVLGFVRYVKSRDEYRKAKENRSDGNDNGGTV